MFSAASRSKCRGRGDALAAHSWATAGPEARSALKTLPCNRTVVSIRARMRLLLAMKARSATFWATETVSWLCISMSREFVS